MKKQAIAYTCLILAAGAAQAQPADVPANDHAAPHADVAGPATPAEPATPADSALPADPATDTAATPAEPAIPAGPAADAAVTAAADLSEAEIDSFAKATVALQEIQADTAIAPEAKQQAMAAAVADAGLDPAKYNEIGRAAQSDAELRAKVQTAMSKYAGERPSDG